jgi:cytosine/adenosine deaminase-related metal-dependent hydrolase
VRACDLFIDNCTLLCLDASWTIHDRGFIAIEGGNILAVGSSDSPDAVWHRGNAKGSFDASGLLALPGFVNAHTHLPMSAFRGAGEDLPDRLRKYLFPLERRLVNRALVRDASLFTLAEMALSGTTTFADMYYFEDEVARATKEAGLRALLGETVVDFPAPDAEEAYGGIEYARRFIADWKGDKLITPSFAPHAPYTVDAEHLALIAAEAERLDVPVLLHVAEADFEHERFSASHGSVLKYLDTTGILGPRLLAAHMLYVDDQDIELAARRGLAVAHVPASNAKSGRLICPAWRMAKAGVRLGLATDGPISGNGMDMEGVLTIYPKLQKTRERSRDIVSAREALRAATLGGAEALGLGERTGSLEVGKAADLILADTRDFNLQPVYDWYATVVYGMRPHNVRHVLVDGAWLVRDRRMTGFDQDAVMDRMLGIGEECRASIAEISAAAAAPQGVKA